MVAYLIVIFFGSFLHRLLRYKADASLHIKSINYSVFMPSFCAAIDKAKRSIKPMCNFAV